MQQSDVVRAVNKRGEIVYKAQTERGLMVLAKFLGVDSIMARDIFLTVPEENERGLIYALNEHCVTMSQWEPPQPKPVDVSKFTDF